jgi:hypothetical protein
LNEIGTVVNKMRVPNDAVAIASGLGADVCDYEEGDPTDSWQKTSIASNRVTTFAFNGLKAGTKYTVEASVIATNSVTGSRAESAVAKRAVTTKTA